MNKLSPELHGVLDYITVLFLFISPTLFKMLPTGSTFTYILATVHLILTLSTDFSAGIFKIIPLRIHGLIEIVVCIALVGVAIWFRIAGDSSASHFYFIFSVTLFIVWLISEYKPIVKVSS